MFHTPPINPERSLELAKTSRLESYNTSENANNCVEHKQPEMSKDSSNSSTTITEPAISLSSQQQDSLTTVTSPTSSESSSILFPADDQSKKDKKMKKIIKKVKRIPYLTYSTIKLPEELHKLIDDFILDLQAPKYSTPLTTDQVALIFQKFYAQFEEKNKVYCEKNEQFRGFEGQFMEVMEFELCGNDMIYKKIFENNVEDLKLQIYLYDKVFYLKNVIKLKLRDLDDTIFKNSNKEEDQINESLLRKLKLVSKEFNKMNTFTSCMNKLISIRNAFRILNEIINEVFSRQVDGDLLIPNLIYLIVMKHIKNLYLNYKFIKRFKYYKFWNSENNEEEGGEYFYLMTNLLACLTYICNFDYEKDLKLGRKDIEEDLKNYKSENNNVFKRDLTCEEKHSSQMSEKRKLIEKLNIYNDTENNERSLESISFDEICLKMSKNTGKFKIDDESFDLTYSKIAIPTTSSSNSNNDARPPNRKKSNSITFLKNTIQEYSMSILQQEIEYNSLFSSNNSNNSNNNNNNNGHPLSASSSTSSTCTNSNIVHGNSTNITATSPSSASSITSVSSTTSTNATTITNNSTNNSATTATNNNNQIIKTVLDTSLKFLGSKIAQSASNNNSSSTNLSIGNGIPRSNSMINGLGNNNASTTDTETSYFIKNRSTSTVNSGSTAESNNNENSSNIIMNNNNNNSFAVALQSRRNRSNSANSYHSNNMNLVSGSPVKASSSFSGFMKWKSPNNSNSLNNKIIIDGQHEFSKIDKEFNELSIKELQEIYHNYNLLIDKINNNAKDSIAE